MLGAATVHTPLILPSAAEGWSQIFRLISPKEPPYVDLKLHEKIYYHQCPTRIALGK